MTQTKKGGSRSRPFAVNFPSAVAWKHRVARRSAIGDLQAEQAADQFDGDAGGAAAFVEKRIELDDIDGTNQLGIRAAAP